MAPITNFVPDLPVFSNLHWMMSCPVFSPSDPLLGPKTHPTHLNTFQNFQNPQNGGGVLTSTHQSETCKISQKVPKRCALAYSECLREILSFGGFRVDVWTWATLQNDLHSKVLQRTNAVMGKKSYGHEMAHTRWNYLASRKSGHQSTNIWNLHHGPKK